MNIDEQEEFDLLQSELNAAIRQRDAAIEDHARAERVLNKALDNAMAERETAIAELKEMEHLRDCAKLRAEVAEARADVLAAECRAWRLNADHPLWDYLKEAVAATDAAKALGE